MNVSFYLSSAGIHSSFYSERDLIREFVFVKNMLSRRRRHQDSLTFNDAFEEHVIQEIGAQRTARMMKDVVCSKKQNQVI